MPPSPQPMPQPQLQDDPTLSTLRTQAASGVPEAVYKLACALVARGDVDEAFALHGIAADAGHGGSQVEYGRMLLHGSGTDPDPRLAVEWLLRAEGIGNPIAGYYLALVALGSVALPRDGRINERVLTAVQHDYPPALRAAAIHFGRRAEPEAQTLCIRLLHRAAGRGDLVAAQLLAERVRRGEGCPPQPTVAEELRRQLASYGVAALPALSTTPQQQHTRGSTPVAADMLALEEALTPAQAVQLGDRPSVSRIDGLLSADECRLLIASALPRLQRRDGPDAAAAFGRRRRAGGGSAARFDPAAEDLALRVVQLRMARSARVELTQAEHLLVQRQEPAQRPQPRRDYLPFESMVRDRPEAGNRLRTLCVHLSAAEAGGVVVFPGTGIEIAPEAGRAIVFDNLDADGLPEVRALHAALPVQRGEQWMATLWLREQRYRDY